jgi:hypothetical protein
VWTARATIDHVHAIKGSKSFSGIDFARPVRRPREVRSVIRDPGFQQVVGDLQKVGYKPLLGNLEESLHLFRHFPGTRVGLRRERNRLDALLGGPLTSTPMKGRGRLDQALDEFGGTPAWQPAGAGWCLMNPVRLAGGGTIRFSILLVQRDDGTLVGGRDLCAQASVMVTPAGRNARAVIKKFMPTILAAGYAGDIVAVRSAKTGQPAWVIGDFWRNRLGRGGLEAEKARLEELADRLRVPSRVR